MERGREPFRGAIEGKRGARRQARERSERGNLEACTSRNDNVVSLRLVQVGAQGEGIREPVGKPASEASAGAFACAYACGLAPVRAIIAKPL